VIPPAAVSSGALVVRQGQFFLHGRPFFCYAGEIHYFRLPRAAWLPRLKQAKATGLNTIASYIPWIWHAPKPAQYDFDGKTLPERNLVAWLELLAKLGLSCFARIGPVCHGELVGEGLPRWLIEQPALRLRQPNGQPHPYPPLITYLHPTFQQAIDQWYDRLLPILRRYEVSRGGPVILLQLDNEISMLSWVMKAPDYHPVVTQGYREFIEQQYQSLDAVNRAYGLRLRTWKELAQPRGVVEQESWAQLWDWAAFHRWYYAEYFARLSARVHAHGLRLPVVANIPQFYDYNFCARALPGPMTTSMFRQFARRVHPVLFGGAYQLRRCEFENFHDLWAMNECVRAIASPEVPGLCVEFPTGVLNDRPRIYPSDVELTLKLAVGHGLNGVNCYMFAGGKTPPPLAYRSHYHEWQAPLSSRGERRPHHEPLQRFGRWLATWQELFAGSHVVYDAGAIGWYPPYYMTEYLTGRWADQLQVTRDRLFFDGLWRLLTLAGYRFPWLDLQRATLAELQRHRRLFVFALEWMDRTVQENLVQYVRQGGRLCLTPQVPMLDLRMQPELTLAQALQVRTATPITPTLAHLGAQEVLVEERQCVFNVLNAQVIATTTEGKPCGFLKQLGAGQVLVAGFGLTHLFDYHVTAMRALAERLGVTPCVEVTPWDVQAVVRSDGAHHWICLANVNDVPKTVHLRAALPGQAPLRLPQRGSVRVPARSAWWLPWQCPLSPTITVSSATCEIERVTSRARTLRLSLHTMPGTPAELHCQGVVPRQVLCQDTPLRILRTTTGWSLKWIPATTDQQLILLFR